MTPFYKGVVVWVLGNYIVPPGNCYMYIDPNTGQIIIKSFSGGLKFEGADYSHFSDSNGAAYTSLAAFKGATQGFFATDDIYPA